jgi:hypothetical protein
MRTFGARFDVNKHVGFHGNVSFMKQNGTVRELKAESPLAEVTGQIALL